MASIKTYTLIVLSLALPILVSAQLTTEADWKRQVYEKEFTAGVVFHTRGLGLNFRYLKFKDGFSKLGWDFDLVSIRHPKEIKFQQSGSGSTRGFVYGKLNGLYALRVGYGRDKILFDKTDKGSIAISWTTFGGPSFGLLKPVYLQVFKETDGGGFRPATERYDPEVHDYADIYGQAPFFTGIQNTSIRLGVYAKTGVAFDYNFSDQRISTLEVGVLADYYPAWFGLYSDEKVPIMDGAENYNLWLQFYLTVNFGTKWN